MSFLAPSSILLPTEFTSRNISDSNFIGVEIYAKIYSRIRVVKVLYRTFEIRNEFFNSCKVENVRNDPNSRDNTKSTDPWGRSIYWLYYHLKTVKKNEIFYFFINIFAYTFNKLYMYLEPRQRFKVLCRKIRNLNHRGIYNLIWHF